MELLSGAAHRPFGGVGRAVAEAMSLDMCHMHTEWGATSSQVLAGVAVLPLEWVR